MRAECTVEERGRERERERMIWMTSEGTREISERRERSLRHSERGSERAREGSEEGGETQKKGAIRGVRSESLAITFTLDRVRGCANLDNECELVTM